MDKLTWSYAENKGYTDWAKKMVGHWESTMYFGNEDKGCWRRSGQRIYNTLYRGSLDKNCLRTIYGEQGATIRDYWGDLTEVNFGCGRYVVALSPLGVFSERDLIIRAEDLQLKFKEEADDSTNVPNTKDV